MSKKMNGSSNLLADAIREAINEATEVASDKAVEKMAKRFGRRFDKIDHDMNIMLEWVAEQHGGKSGGTTARK